MGRKPALQYVGPGSATLEISGVIFPTVRSGRHQVDAMRAQADTGKPLPLVAGTGEVWGNFVIEAITEDASEFLGNGVPLQQKFTVRLREYGDDL
ncbi:MAG: phage tail protein [Pseudomonadota bacterium]